MPYKIGSTSGGMVTLKSLGIPDPKSVHSNYSDVRDLGDASVRGVGYPHATWQWGYLSLAQRDALRAYCTGASSTAYIETKTLDNADVFDQFSAIMIWPNAGEERFANRRLGFSIEFRKLVAI